MTSLHVMQSTPNLDINPRSMDACVSMPCHSTNFVDINSDAIIYCKNISLIFQHWWKCKSQLYSSHLMMQHHLPTWIWESKISHRHDIISSHLIMQSTLPFSWNQLCHFHDIKFGIHAMPLTWQFHEINFGIPCHGIDINFAIYYYGIQHHRHQPRRHHLL